MQGSKKAVLETPLMYKLEGKPSIKMGLTVGLKTKIMKIYVIICLASKSQKPRNLAKTNFEVKDMSS